MEIIEAACRYHLDAIRRYGFGWRIPQVRHHRKAFIRLNQMRRYLRRHPNGS